MMMQQMLLFLCGYVPHEISKYKSICSLVNSRTLVVCSFSTNFDASKNYYQFLLIIKYVIHDDAAEAPVLLLCGYVPHEISKYKSICSLVNSRMLVVCILL